MKKRLTAIALAAVVAVTSLGGSAAISTKTAEAEDFSVNYAEALQKSMYFYEVQQSGELPDWNEVSWKSDSMINEDGTSADVAEGGWYDAGDHLKFSLTNAYTASVLAWGIYQNKEAVEEAGLYDLYTKNLKWGLDYLVKCDLGDCVIGTIGDGSFDHVWWGSAEVYMRKYTLKTGETERPYDTITCTTTIAEMAAALAGGYLVFKDSDPTTAEEYLTHAKSLFTLADETWSDDDAGQQKTYYNVENNSGTDNFVDELFYAANWLYMATEDQSYLDLCEDKYIPIAPKESQSTEIKYTWGFCWDDTFQGAALLYAINTGKQEWIDHVAHHLDYWIDGYGGKQVAQTPDGLSWLSNWGSLRYATTTAFIAKTACDTIFKDNDTLRTKYDDWAKSQMDYAFGDNDNNMSYVLGVGENNPVNVHHRTASGIHDDHWNALGTDEDEDGKWQTEYAHTLYGALEGGPNQDGSFKDANASYENTEVAIDYNAGFTACLCAMIGDYGGTKLDNFPEDETPKWSEWEISATLNGKGDSYSEIRTWTMNHTAWPARVAKNISFNYYFDVSEILAAGLSVDDIKLETKSQQYQEGEQGYATISGPYKYDGDASGNTYYAKITFEDGRAIMPTGQSEHRDEVQFRVSIPDAINGQSTKGAWDPTNDWSYTGIEDAPNDLVTTAALNDHITMYVDNTLVWGTEPDGTTPSDVEPATEETTEAATEATTAAATTEAVTDAPETTETPTTEVVPTIATTTVADTTAVATTEKAEEVTKPDSTNRLWGDVNVDGDVSISDVVLLNKSLVSAATLSKEGSLNADCSYDTVVDSKDSLVILKVLVQSIDKADLPIIQ